MAGGKAKNNLKAMLKNSSGKTEKIIDIIFNLYYNKKAGLRHGGPGHPGIAAQSVTYSCR